MSIISYKILNTIHSAIIKMPAPSVVLLYTRVVTKMGCSYTAT